MWEYRGNSRPSFAGTPGAGQESVWDYPRPPRLAADERHVEVFAGAQRIAASRSTFRILETASPPTFYLPPEDVETSLLRQDPCTSVCEWKGTAHYWRLVAQGSSGELIGWSYAAPSDDFQAIAGYFSFYPGVVKCFVDGERVTPQPGGFYGGWITAELVGSFKRGPGSAHG